MHNSSFNANSTSELSLLSVFEAAITPIAKVVIVVSLSFLCVHRKVVNDEVISGIGRLVFIYSLPAFIFVEVGSQFTTEEIGVLWVGTVLFAFQTVVGAILGRILAAAIGNGVRFYKVFITVAVCLTNTGSLPFVLLEAICVDSDLFECSSTRPMIYALVFMICQVLVSWTVAFDRLHSGSRKLRRISMPLPEDFHKRPLWKRFFPPPIIAVFISFAISLSPMQTWFFGPDPPLRVITSSLQLIGSGMVPMSLVVLGGDLAFALAQAKGRTAIRHEVPLEGSRVPMLSTLGATSSAANLRELAGTVVEVKPDAYDQCIELDRVETYPTEAVTIQHVDVLMESLGDVDCERASADSVETKPVAIEEGDVQVTVAVAPAATGIVPMSQSLWTSLLSISFLRLFLLPALGFALVHLLRTHTSMLADKMDALIILLEFSMPTALNLSLMCRLVSNGQAQAARLLIFQYPLTAFSITMWMIAFVYYLN